jgi:phosphatidate cytidylyltransferase
MNKNIITRMISAIVIGVIFAIAVFVFRPLFDIILYIIAIFMLIEWYNMTKDSLNYSLLGQIFIPIPIAALLFLSYYDESGWVLATYFCIIWSVDSMSMFGGKFIGGRKLAPTISPNKTISGLLCGIISAVIIVNCLRSLSIYQLPEPLVLSPLKFTIYTVILAGAAQLSDLLISLFKRKFNIKDTGKIIPGHGGMLDRFDSIILTAPLLAIYLFGQF